MAIYLRYQGRTIFSYTEVSEFVSFSGLWALIVLTFNHASEILSNFMNGKTLVVSSGRN
jgi:hypothetical protein